MPSCPTVDQLIRLLAEQLDDAERDTAARHVEDCKSCRDALARLAGEKETDPLSRPVLGARTTAPLPDFLDELARSPPCLSDPVEPIPDIPGFEILAVVGGGGMGVVYKARDLQLDWIVAIKMPRQAALANPNARQRFEREARVLAQLRHPNIVSVHRADLLHG